MSRENALLRDKMLDAAEAVVVRQGISNLTLDAVAAEAGTSKGALLHHFPSKDRLVEAMVTRCAETWRATYMDAYLREREGPGRMARALLSVCLTDVQDWTEQLRRSSSAVFAALAQNPALIAPMRAVYDDLHRRIAEDGLPPGVGEVVVATTDGLWLDWVLGLVPVDQALVSKVHRARRAARARDTGSPGTQRRRPQQALGRAPLVSPRGWLGSAVLLLTVLGTGVGLAAWKYASLQRAAADSAAQSEPTEAVADAVASRTTATLASSAPSATPGATSSSGPGNTCSDARGAVA